MDPQKYINDWELFVTDNIPSTIQNILIVNMAYIYNGYPQKSSEWLFVLISKRNIWLPLLKFFAFLYRYSMGNLTISVADSRLNELSLGAKVKIKILEILVL